MLMNIRLGLSAVITLSLAVTSLVVWMAGSAEPSFGALPDATPPALSSSTSAIGSTVQVSVPYDDDSPPGLAFLYAASGPNNPILGRFTAASLVQNNDGQEVNVAFGMIRIGEDADATKERTVVNATYQCDAQGLVYFVAAFAGEDGRVLSTGSAILGCGTPAPTPTTTGLPPPPPPIIPPASFPQWSLTVTSNSVTPASLAVVATYSDDGPSGFIILSIVSGPAHFTSGSLTSNKDNQKLAVSSKMISVTDDADPSAETTTITASAQCESAGIVLFALNAFVDSGGVFSRSTETMCGGPTATIPPPPTLSAPPVIPTALPPCAPTPMPGVLCRRPADVTCPTPERALLPTVCAVRPPSTGDAGLVSSTSLSQGELP